MKKLKFVWLILSSILMANYSLSQWLNQNIGTTASIYQIECIDATHCFCSGDNGLIKKTSDGTNWVNANTGLSSSSTFLQFQCFDVNTCYTADETYFLKTYNAGATWLGTLLGFYMTHMHFPSLSVGFASDLNQNLYKTTDGGTTWNLSTAIASNISLISGIKFYDDLTGIVGVRQSGSEIKMYKTVDGGMNWSMIYSKTIGISPLISDIQFIDAQLIYVSASNGLILKSTDGGSNWTELVNPNQNDAWCTYQKVSFIDAERGYVSGSLGHIVKTTDGGQSWIEEDLFDYNNVDLLVANMDTVYVVGGYGIHKNSNAGLASVKTINLNENSFLIFPNPANEFINIELKTASLGSDFLVRDMQSKVIYRQKIDSEKFTLNLTKFDRGLYYVEVDGKMESLIVD